MNKEAIHIELTCQQCWEAKRRPVCSGEDSNEGTPGKEVRLVWEQSLGAEERAALCWGPAGERKGPVC